MLLQSGAWTSLIIRSYSHPKKFLRRSMVQHKISLTGTAVRQQTPGRVRCQCRCLVNLVGQEVQRIADAQMQGVGRRGLQAEAGLWWLQDERQNADRLEDRQTLAGGRQ